MSKKKKVSFGDARLNKTLHKNLEFTAAEQYKTIRSNLEFTLPLGEKCPIIGITSSNRGEGKSTTAINLSYTIAEKGAKVLLVDGDLRLPSIAQKLGMRNRQGLSDLLKGGGAQIAEYQSGILSNWYILPSGPTPPNPAELLGSERMEKILTQLKEHFDYIVIDLPPVNIVSDAVSISGPVSGLIVVVKEDQTEKKELEQCVRQLKLSRFKILGVVMTNSKATGGTYAKKKYYKSYGDTGKKEER